MFFKKTFYKNNTNIINALCYHSVSDVITYQSKLHQISPLVFEEQLKRAIKYGITFLPIDEYLIEKSKGRKKISSITFDDGYKNILNEASPILCSLNVPFTIFLTTRLLNGEIFWRDMVRITIDNDWVVDFLNYLQIADPKLTADIENGEFYRTTKSNLVNSKLLEISLVDFLSKKKICLQRTGIYLDNEDISKLPRHLASIGNHTVNHFRMSTLDKDSQYDEISDAQFVIDGLNCNTTKVFAIPFGENGSFDQNTIDILEDLNYVGFLMTNQDQLGFKKPIIEVSTRNLLYSNRILPKNEVSII